MRLCIFTFTFISFLPCWPSLFSGLDYWTHGNCLWGEKGTPMRRAKTPGHKVCSSVVVTHLKVASSSVPSHSLFFLLLLYLDGNLGVATPRPRANKCAWALLVYDAVFQSGWVFFICPYCSPVLSRCFFRDERRMWNPLLVANCNPFPFRALSLERKAWVRGFT